MDQTTVWQRLERNKGLKGEGEGFPKMVISRRKEVGKGIISFTKIRFVNACPWVWNDRNVHYQAEPYRNPCWFQKYRLYTGGVLYPEQIGKDAIYHRSLHFWLNGASLSFYFNVIIGFTINLVTWQMFEELTAENFFLVSESIIVVDNNGFLYTRPRIQINLDPSDLLASTKRWLDSHLLCVLR